MSKVQVVWFRDLVRWDIKHYLTEFKSKFPLVHLKDYIVEKKHRIKPSNFPNETFDILGVNNKDGVYFNESLLGSRIKQPYYQVRSGEIFYNPYRVNVGSIGIVPPEFDLKYTSPAYVIFQTDETRLLSQYLVFVLKSAWFNEHLRAKTRGSVRQNLSFEALCDLQIPLPPLKIQKQIVAKIESIKAQIKALQEEEKRLKDEIEAYIYIALGLEKKQEAKRQKVFIIRFKDLDRWDTRHNQSIAINLCHTDSIPYHTEQPNCHTEAIAEVSTNIESKRDFDTLSLRGEAEAFHNPQNNIKADFTESMDCHDFATQNLAMTGLDLKAPLDSIPTPPPHGWEVKTLGEICEIINRNWHKYYKNETFPYIQISNVTQKGIDGYSLIHYDNAPSRAKTLVKTGELLISLTRPNLGAFAVVEQEYNNFVVSSGFAVVDSKNIVTNHYIKHILQSQIGIDIFNQIMSGALYPAISQGDLQNLKIPLPPLKVQEKIVAHIHKIESSIATTQEKAKALELELTHYIESTL
ncbi:restriction endonuclease subunit S [Helicobacter bilis]|uniref:restriction endonuclease subunit S n=1 Tax=Helicobacter bilis TaxID=37372 RepID=UPI002557F41F|nr:restriction endonuclease subunit S [Helicobacter bilis]